MKAPSWRNEAAYWKQKHHELLEAMDDIAWGRSEPHVDGDFGALLALHYEHTGARHPSPRERWRILEHFRGRPRR